MIPALHKLTSLVILCLLFCILNLARTADESSELHQNEIENNESIDLSMYGKRIFGNPVNRASTSIAKSSNENPEELGPYLEGDILIPERNGITDKSYRWPRGVIPYEIKGKFPSNEISIITHAINEFHRKTCIRFRLRTNDDKDYISIVNGNSGCWSSIGRLGGRQEVNLQSNFCFRTFGTSIHELMHAIGFFHEQNRYERDSYIRVLTKNIKPGMQHNFEKYSPKISNGFGIPYDYASVLHYSSRSFSVNGKPTLLALLNTTAARSMGQRNGFSSGDIAKINAMYRCSKSRN